MGPRAAVSDLNRREFHLEATHGFHPDSLGSSMLDHGLGPVLADGTGLEAVRDHPTALEQTPGTSIPPPDLGESWPAAPRRGSNAVLGYA